VRLGLKTLINDQPDMEVIGEAGSSAEAIQMVANIHPKVVLMDIRLPGEGGLEATRQIVNRFPDTKVVMLTSFADEELVMSAIRAGAVGYLLKEVGNEEVLRGIRAAAQGESVMDPATTTRMFARMRAFERKGEQDAFHDLSQREMEVLYEVSLARPMLKLARALTWAKRPPAIMSAVSWKSCNFPTDRVGHLCHQASSV